jgi:DNA-binding SARP family transcriptional activator
VGGVIRVFGPAGVDGDGVLAGRDRQVLAALVVTRRQQCPAERVAAAVYGEAEPPPTWRKVVQGSIVRLRRVLGRRAIETTARSTSAGSSGW